jgi:hypothetical protein
MRNFQEATQRLSADFTQRNTGSAKPRSMSRAEPPLARELRGVIAELREKRAAQERLIAELRNVIVALMEPDMPRILGTPGGIMVLDKK